MAAGRREGRRLLGRPLPITRFPTRAHHRPCGHSLGARSRRARDDAGAARRCAIRLARGMGVHVARVSLEHRRLSECAGMSLEQSSQGSAFGRAREPIHMPPSMMSAVSPASDVIPWSSPCARRPLRPCRSGHRDDRSSSARSSASPSRMYLSCTRGDPAPEDPPLRRHARDRREVEKARFRGPPSLLRADYRVSGCRLPRSSSRPQSSRRSFRAARLARRQGGSGDPPRCGPRRFHRPLARSC